MKRRKNEKLLPSSDLRSVLLGENRWWQFGGALLFCLVGIFKHPKKV